MLFITKNRNSVINRLKNKCARCQQPYQPEAKHGVHIFKVRETPSQIHMATRCRALLTYKACIPLQLADVSPNITRIVVCNIHVYYYLHPLF